MATRTVGSGQSYATIAEAVAALINGDIIDIYDGTYNEHVTSGSNKNNYTIRVHDGQSATWVLNSATGANFQTGVNNGTLTLIGLNMSATSSTDVSGSIINVGGSVPGPVTITNCSFSSLDGGVVLSGMNGTTTITGTTFSNSEYGTYLTMAPAATTWAVNYSSCAFTMTGWTVCLSEAILLSSFTSTNTQVQNVAVNVIDTTIDVTSPVIDELRGPICFAYSADMSNGGTLTTAIRFDKCVLSAAATTGTGSTSSAAIDLATSGTGSGVITALLTNTTLTTGANVTYGLRAGSGSTIFVGYNVLADETKFNGNIRPPISLTTSVSGSDLVLTWTWLAGAVLTPDHYTLLIDGISVGTVSSPYTATNKGRFKHNFLVQAIDGSEQILATAGATTPVVATIKCGLSLGLL